jgi:hypothetical protein
MIGDRAGELAAKLRMAAMGHEERFPLRLFSIFQAVIGYWRTQSRRTLAQRLQRGTPLSKNREFLRNDATSDAGAPITT